MQNVIVGTAGHIDHGKTCLIKALTGVDTDRLKEEKKRGITIELGFTNLPTDSDINIGIIDVPGHEKFVKNMLAGVGGIDFILLVIAADEGVMPQTKEHMDILKLLNIQKGFVVLTKCDNADEEWIELVKDDITSFVEGSFLENAPIVEVSSHTGQGIDTLKKMIIEEAKKLPPHNTEASSLRLPIDRVFTMKGHGTVITGTLIEGSCKTGDDIELYPSRLPAKVRSIQVHGKTVDKAYAGQRTALNLTVKTEDIDRGFVIARPDTMIQTYMLDVRLHILENTERTVINNSRVHFYYGSDELIGKVILLDKDELKAGETAYAQIRFDRQIALKRLDYFVIRFYSPMETIGGGIILDASPRRHKRNVEAVIESCRIKDGGTDLEVMEQFLKECSFVFPDNHLMILKTRFPAPLTSSLLNQLKGKEIALEISKQIFIHKTFYETASQMIVNWLNQFHKENALSEGMSKEELKSRMKQNFYDAQEKRLDIFYEYLIAKKVIKENNGLTSVYSFKLKHNDDNRKELQELIDQYKSCGYQMPKADEIIKNSKNAKTTKQLLDQLLKDGELIKVSPPYYMHKDAWNQALHLLVDYIQEHGSITLADFRSLLDSSRKYTQMILECYDSKRITKMTNDCRTLLKNPF